MSALCRGKPLLSYSEALQRLDRRVSVVCAACGNGKISVETLWQDLRYALRAASGSPGLFLAAALTLALGIGANTAVFSAVNGILLKPLPIRDEGRVVVIGETSPAGDRRHARARTFVALRDQNHSFSRITGHSGVWVNVTGDGEPEQLNGMRITASLLPLFGVEPMLGRGISPEEDLPGANRVALLAYNFWRRRYAGDSGVVGRAITLDGVSHTIIGVLPERFRMYNEDPEVWVALALDPAAPQKYKYLMTVYGRLKPATTQEQGARDLQAIAQRLEMEWPESNKGWGITVRNCRYEELTDQTRFGLFTVFGLVAVVLLIACSNVASLLLARSVARSHEIAVRVALGAGRARIARQAFTESVLLVVIGTAAGLVLARVGLSYLLLSGPQAFPRMFEVTIDGRVLAFALALCLITAVLFGSISTRQFGPGELNRLLKEGGRSNVQSSGAARTRKVLLVTEVALSLVLVIGAAVLIRSFLHLQLLNRGFRSERMLTLQMSIPLRNYSSDTAMTRYYEEILRHVMTVQGVEEVGAASNLPLDGQMHTALYYKIDNGPIVSASQRSISPVRIVNTGYFRALQIPIVQGRAFSEHDRDSQPYVAIVSQSFARRWWPGQNPIGHKVIMAGPRQRDATREVVGVARDIIYPTGKAGDSMEIYLPYLQTPFGYITLLVRTHGDPMRLMPSIRSAIRSIDKDQAISFVDTLEGRITETNGASRWYALLLGSFAVIAVTLSIVGVYGVISYSTAQRTQEIGVRMALGASPGDILRLVLGEAALLAGIGLTIGLGVYLLASRLLNSLVYGITPTDPSTIVLVLLLLGSVALVAAWIPARRAARLDPAIALRNE